MYEDKIPICNVQFAQFFICAQFRKFFKLVNELSAAIPIRLSWLCFWTIREVLNNNSAEGISRNVLGCVVIHELVILNQKLSKSFKDIAISLAVISIFFQCMES